ncbi:autophagy-related protein 2 homolog A-like [Strigops habroptila]|uniref:autophagy-related protein 2 homolog A-like n=1 Tax=Strigops habroptila TaxID=2489341 RepID=UPI0011CFA69C|nr:autophagy-related protein 2 homolog A-like [Strigops habroptila]
MGVKRKRVGRRRDRKRGGGGGAGAGAGGGMRRWTEPLKARAARYALERSLGPFLEERLRLEQLSLDLRGGTGCLRLLRLCAPAVDELLAAAGAPLELREGVLGSVTVTVPWAALGSRSCGLRVTGLRLALRPRQRGGPGAAPPSSRRRDPPPELPPLEGLEALALTIDGVLRRLRVELEDTELRVELPGGVLELRLPRVEYEDEGGPGPGPPPVLLKGLRFGDLRLLWHELPPPEAPEAAPPPPVPVGLSPGPSRLSLRLKQNQALPGPAVEVQGEVGALHLLLPPPLLGALWGLLGTFDPPDPGPPPAGRSRPLGPQDLQLIERELSRCLRGGDPPDPPGDPPGAELFYSMTGSLGGQSPAPPEATPPPSPSPSAAGSPRFQPPSSRHSPPPGQGPPRPGGCRVRVTLGTVTMALPQPGCPPPPRGRAAPVGGAVRRPCPALPPPQEPPPPRELSLDLGPLESDLDLGLLERFAPALVGLGPAPGTDTPPGEEWAWPRVRWAAPRAVLRLRLPRVDLRPPPARGPPPSLRPESLRLEMGAPRGAGGPRGGALVCSRLLVVYEAEDMGTIPCLRVEPGPGPGGTRCLPTLEVTVPEPPSGAPPGSPPSPFSAQRSIYESHELVLPGTPQELGAFVGGALGGAPCSLRLALPRAHLSLRPPALLQRLYSRINELLLWEPAGPAPSGDHAPSAGNHAPFGSHAPSAGSAPSSSDTFKPCKSAPGTDSDEEEEEEEEDDEGPGVPPGAVATPPQSSVVVLITVPRGRVTADCHPPAGSPGSRLVLEVGEGRLCLVPTPGGRRGGAGACAEVMELRLWHGPVPEEGGEELEVPGGEGPSPPLQLVIGPWEEPGPPPEAPPDPRMLVLALESDLSPPGDTRELVVSVALQGALLQHRPAPPAQHWFSQLLALLALEDEPVLGYTAPTPLTRLHLHLRRCGLHYRPPPLPLRVLVTAETLSVTSSSVPDTSTFLLRLLVDDGAVLLSDRWREPRLELQRDFICVLDVDFLELLLSSWKGNGEGQSPPCPRDELRLAPARLRARTCPDSAAAIAQLLRHLSGPTARPTARPTPGPTPGPTAGPAPAHGDTQVPASAPHGPPTATINQQDLTDALRDAPRQPHGAPQPPDEALPPPPTPPSLCVPVPGRGGAPAPWLPHSGCPGPPRAPPGPAGGQRQPRG